MITQDRFRGCLAGLAAGDAVGTTVEFMPRGSFEPLRDMVVTLQGEICQFACLPGGQCPVGIYILQNRVCGAPV